MSLYPWLLSSLLVGQIGGNPTVPVTSPPPMTNPRGPAVPAATYPGNPTNSGIIVHPSVGQVFNRSQPVAVPARVVQPPAVPVRATTAQLVADALTLPPGHTLSGRPVSLLSVMATVPQRQRQIEAVHAYWRLAEAVGEYHFSHERQQRLARLPAGSDEAAEVRTARAVAAAQLQEAEVQVTTAQHDLAEILLLAPGTPLPLPADQPLVGPYRTLFTELFSGKQAPAHAQMLDQTLPLRNRAVESHAAALLAAEDGLDAAIELQSSGQGRLADVIAALDAQVRQQRAFLAAVCRYNHDIADYALRVVSPQTTPELIVGTLIKQDRPAGQPVVPLPTVPLSIGATVPAAYQEPIVAPAGTAIPSLPTRGARSGAAAGRTPEAATTVKAEESAPANSPAVLAPSNLLPSNDSRGTALGPAAGIGHPVGSGKTGRRADSKLQAPSSQFGRRRPHDPHQPETDRRKRPSTGFRARGREWGAGSRRSGSRGTD